MRPTLTRRIIQLKPLKSKVPLIACRMQQELRHLALGTRIHCAATDTRRAVVAQRDRSNSADGLWPRVPGIRVLVDSRRERGNVECVRRLAGERPGRAEVGEGVDEEV
jgi:hypothetical protein